MKRLLLLLGVATILVGCSNAYVKQTVNGIVVSVNEESKINHVLMRAGKTVTIRPQRVYNCTHEIDLGGDVITIEKGQSCRYESGDVVRVQSLHDKDTDEFIKYQILKD